MSSRLEILPGDIVHVESMEKFDISNKVMAIFGQLSGIKELGIQMVHSPFIDPCFRGRLYVGLANVSNKNTYIDLGDIIGKISFFDISDTYPVDYPDNESTLGKSFAERNI